MTRAAQVIVTSLLLCFFASSCRAQTCDQTLAQHVYHPQRLAVINACQSATGTIVDATASRKHRSKDGVRHEADGDTHGWLKLDPGQDSLLAPGNLSAQGGNLVFEVICQFRVTQADAKAACKNFKSSVKLPPVGSHVRITGPLIEDLDHKPIHREIHPVTSIEIIQETATTNVVFRAELIRCTARPGDAWYELGPVCHSIPGLRVRP